MKTYEYIAYSGNTGKQIVLFLVQICNLFTIRHLNTINFKMRNYNFNQYK